MIMALQKSSSYADYLSDSSDVECIETIDPPSASFSSKSHVPSVSIRNDFYSSGSEDEDLPSSGLFDRIAKTRPGTTATLNDPSFPTASKPHCSELEVHEIQLPEIKAKEPAAKRPRVAKPKKDAAEKEEEKRRKQEEREKKKREKQLETTKKRLLAEVKKKSSLKECQKLMTVIVDTGLMQYGVGAGLVAGIRESQMKLDVTEQPIPNLVTFTREITEVKEVDGMVSAESREEVQDNLLLYMTADQFAEMSLAQLGRGFGCSLTDHVHEIHRLLGKKRLTLLVQGIDDYYRKCKMQKARKKRDQSQNFIENADVHQVLTEILLLTGCNVNLVEKDQDVLESIMQYAKAVAEAPFKEDRLDTGLDFHLDPGSTVQIDKEAGGPARAWRQQLMVLNNVSTEVANAIATAYPSPGHLMQAYDISTQEEGQKLLQDIVVRRGYGVLETNRRVGKELSGKIYKLFTATNPETLLINKS